MHKIIIRSFFLVLTAFAFSTAKADSLASDRNCILTGMSKVSVGDTLIISSSRDSASLQINKKEEVFLAALPIKEIQQKKKWVTAIFAFPFPFGFVAAHRVMLGTKPWIPIMYVATFGGGFGLLPLVDFFVILFSKDLEQYENNPNLFMWIK